MKTKLLGLFLVAACMASSVRLALAAAPATKADIAKLVAEAASYQPGQSREPFRQLENLLRESPSGTRRQLEDGLLRLLGPESTYEAREFASTQLGIIGSRKALPVLAGLLKSDSTAGLACLALTTYPAGKADSILRSALASSQGTARLQIITTLGDRHDAKSVKELAALARNSDPAVAKAALAALGKIGDEASWKAIASLSMATDSGLQHAVTEASLRCAQALAKSGNTRAATPIYEELLAPSQPVYVRRAALDAVLRLDKEHAQQRVLDVLRGSDAAIKPVAIAAVRNLPSRGASDVFAAGLPKLSSQEQVWMIDSLAERDDVVACAAIGKSLFSPEATVRFAAIETLGRIGDSWCVRLFARALNRTKGAEEVRAIESALIDLQGGRMTDRAIITAVEKSSGTTRAELITSLARRQGPGANALLLTEARGPDVTAAKAALRALTRTAQASDANPLLQRLTTTHDADLLAEAAGAAAHALAQIDKPSRRSELVCQALRLPQSQESRIAVLGLLPACGDATGLAAVEAATSDANSSVREAGVRALTEWPEMAAWEAIVAVYRQPGREVLRSLALRGLVRLATEANARPEAKLINRYRQLLAGAHSDADLRLILGGLSGAAQPGALELALPLLDKPGVRAEAEVAVKKIAEAIKAQHPQAAQAALKRVKQATNAQ